MFPAALRRALASLLVLAPAAAFAQADMLFPDASETVPELIELYQAADSDCRLAMSRDVQVAVACVSRSIYGAALNERDWCRGRDGEANAHMQWHECEADSRRFPPLEVPLP